MFNQIIFNTNNTKIMAWTKKLRSEQVDVSGGGDNVTRYIFNDLQSTTSASNTVVRQFNIGTLADVKMIRINAEFERLVGTITGFIDFLNPLTNNTIRIKSFNVTTPYARYYQDIFLNQASNDFVLDNISTNYLFGFSGSGKNTFDPSVDYDISLTLRIVDAGATAISRGFLIEIYK